MRFFKLLFRKLKQKNKSTKSKNSGNLLHRLRNLWKTLSGANRAKTKPRRKKTSSLPRVSGIQIKSRSEMKYIQCSNETRSDIENQPTKVSSANEPEPVTLQPGESIQPEEPIEPPDPVSQPIEIPPAKEITPTVPSIEPEASAQELPPPGPEAMIPLNDAPPFDSELAPAPAEIKVRNDGEEENPIAKTTETDHSTTPFAPQVPHYEPAAATDLKERFTAWLHEQQNCSEISARWTATILRNLPAEFGFPVPTYDFYRCDSIAELDRIIDAYKQSDHFNAHDNRLKGEVTHAISKYREYIRTINPEADRIALYPGGKTYRPHSLFNLSPETTVQHVAELQKYIVQDNVVYLPADSSTYRNLNSFVYGKGISLEKYIEKLGFVRTQQRPVPQDDGTESDMEIRTCEGDFIARAFAENPLIGSAILTGEETQTILQEAEKILKKRLSGSIKRLLRRDQAILTLALTHYTKNWDPDAQPKFWEYAAKQFGYLDKGKTVEKILQDVLKDTLDRNRRFFIENERERSFRSTVTMHAFSPRESWMAFFDFLFDFYKENLGWTIDPDEPLIGDMLQVLSQRFSDEQSVQSEDLNISISSRSYSFREGIRKLILLRPKFTRSLVVRMLQKIDSLINNNIKEIKHYEEKLCEDWFERKLTEISDSRKSEKDRSSERREIVWDYSKIRARFYLKNEDELQIGLPEIRLQRTTEPNLTLEVYSADRLISTFPMAWYGNELGKTLKSKTIGLHSLIKNEFPGRLRLRLASEEEAIYDSEERLYRTRFLFSGKNELTGSILPPGDYTLILPSDKRVQVERGEQSPIQPLKVPAANGYFVELEPGFIVRIDSKIAYYDRGETETEFRILSPQESESLPTYIEDEEEFEFADRKSACHLVLSRPEVSTRYVIRKDEERIDLSALDCSEEKTLYALPLDNGKDVCRIRILDLGEEKLLFKRDYLLIDQASCKFSREFYYSSEDYRDAKVEIQLDELSESIDFSAGDEFISFPYRNGDVQIAIPKITLSESTGKWLTPPASAWYYRDIPQDSRLQITAPKGASASLLIDGEPTQFDKNGSMLIGNKLHSMTLPSARVHLDLKIERNQTAETYPLGSVFFKEGFLRRPKLWEENGVLFWDLGGAFIGSPNQKFILTLALGSNAPLTFDLDESTDSLLLPENVPGGEYQYKIAIRSKSLFSQTEIELAQGECIIGDKNLLRFQNRRIRIPSITNGEKTIEIHPCYIDQIKFEGIQPTSEGNCPVYSGILFRYKDGNNRKNFSSEAFTDERGITRYQVNPVLVIYIGERTMSITNSHGDGFYYRKIFDEMTKTEYSLTDREPNQKNKNRYDSVDLFFYTTERP